MQRRQFLQNMAATSLAGAAAGVAGNGAENPPATSPPAGSLYDPRLHLFIDDQGILKSRGLERVVGRPRKHFEPVIRADRPWESPWVYAWGSVLREPGDGRFRMWYESMGHEGDISLMRTLYAESADGIQWRKPDLGRYAMLGYENTNILLMSSAIHTPGDRRGEEAWKRARVEFRGDGPGLHDLVTHVDGTNVVRDENEPDPQKRYKYLACMWRRNDNGRFAHHLMTSPDGIHWTMPPEQVLRVNDGTKVVWDPRRKLWILTWLSNKVLDGGEVARFLEIAESPDLRSWTMVGKPFELDEQDGFGRIQQGHFLQAFAYGDQYVGVANMIHTKEGWAQGYLVSSRDGRHWDRTLRRDPFLAIGAEDDFDADSAEASLSPPILVGDELYLYYCGRARRHWAPMACTGAIGLVRFRRDRFAGLANGGWFNRDTNNNESNDAEVLTRPVEVTGPRLYVNVRSRQCVNPGTASSTLWGTIRAELLDDGLKPIPGYRLEDSIPYRGDETRAPMSWKAHKNVELLMGRQVHVRLVLNMATVYSYLFA